MELVNEKIVTLTPPSSCSCSPKQESVMMMISSMEHRISKLLSQWNALQMAIKNEWGGRDSLKKSEQLAYDILTWLFHSEALLQVEELENLLHERLLLVFNTEIEDGSIEEVAEQLMIIRDEYLQRNFVSVQSNNIPSLNQKVQKTMVQNLDLIKKMPLP